MKRGMRFFGAAAILLCGIGAGVSMFAADPVSREVPGVRALGETAGLHNVFALGTNVFSGSSPEGDAGFATLARLGVKTIVSVDGSRPDVEAARRHGMRYVHLPHGYDGIGTNVQGRLARAAKDLPGPMYVHCHHGKHRGPAAVAVMCRETLGWSAAEAERWMTLAGTAPQYTGLYASVRAFRPLTTEELARVPADYPETARVAGLVEAMVGVDTRWDHLQACRKAGFRAPPEHPDLDPGGEAVMLWEHFRETRRMPESVRRGEKFLRLLEESESAAREWEASWREFVREPSASARERLERVHEVVGKACTGCHRSHRDAGLQSAN